MSRVIDKDMGWAAIVNEFAGSGVMSASAYIGPDPADFAADGEPYYPLWIEFGTSRGVGLGPGVPRPFIRWTLDAHDNYRAEMREMVRRMVSRRGRKIARGKVPLSADLALVARRVAKDIKYHIKGMGIIDTGRMYRSVKVLRIVSGDGSGTGGTIHAEWG